MPQEWVSHSALYVHRPYGNELKLFWYSDRRIAAPDPGHELLTVYITTKLGRTPACVKTCNSQDTMAATWRKERSTVETNEIMKTAAHRFESWCWRQLHAADTCMFLFCASRLRHQYPRNSTSVCYRHVMSSTREDVIKRTHVLLRCADSSLNHEWSKTASFVSCLDACLDAVGVRPPLVMQQTDME
jgi:hypothetical protein